MTEELPKSGKTKRITAMTSAAIVAVLVMFMFSSASENDPLLDQAEISARSTQDISGTDATDLLRRPSTLWAPQTAKQVIKIKLAEQGSDSIWIACLTPVSLAPVLVRDLGAGSTQAIADISVDFKTNIQAACNAVSTPEKQTETGTKK